MSRDARERDLSPEGFQVAVANQQAGHAIDELQLAAAARAVLQRSSFSTAAVSLAIVDDSTIHELNCRYLDHDWPTDVLSFVLAEHDQHLEGEVIISADTAATAAEEMGWSAAGEQLLYVVHGMLHLIGYRDTHPADAERMRAAEAAVLREFGLDLPHQSTSQASAGATAP